MAGFLVSHIAPGSGERWNTDGCNIITYRRTSKGLLMRFVSLLKIYRLAKSENADCYHCNEPDSWFVGVLLKLSSGSHLVFDIHEDYPAMLGQRRSLKILQVAVATSVRKIFRLFAIHTDRFVLAKQSVLRDFTGYESKAILLRNFPPSGILNSVENIKLSELKKPRETLPFTLIHIGDMGRIRGWPQLLELLSRSDMSNVHLHLIGSFADGSRSEFLNEVETLALSDRILLDSWMTYSDMFFRLGNANVGLVLFQPGYQNHVSAIPHKAFDYMLAGLPVIAPEHVIDLAEIIKTEDCGLLIDASSTEDLAYRLSELMRSPSACQQMGERGKRAVLGGLNWENESQLLIDMYKQLALEQC